LDVEWYRDSNLLASCSVDNKIHIYDISQKTRIKTLEGHQSLVKGLSFDPIGKYLISQGADQKVIVWNVKNWDKVKEISEPFEKPVDAIFFRFKFFFSFLTLKLGK
jgi:protein HIRA/HIR1